MKQGNSAYSLSVLIPLFNEEACIQEALVQNINYLDGLKLDYELIIVNDGSEDGTDEIITKNWVHKPFVIYHKFDKNRGMGAAIRKAMELSSKEYLINVSADYSLCDTLYAGFHKDRRLANILVGVRSDRPGYTRRMKMNSRLYRKIVAWIFKLPLQDYNGVHVYHRSVIAASVLPESNGIFWMAEMLIRANRLNFTIVEIPISMPARTTGEATASKYSTVIQTMTEMIRFYFSNK